jgi:hypothetical protein
MRAATSPLGVLTDPPIVCVMVAVVALVSVILYNRLVIVADTLPMVFGVAALPIAAGFGITFWLGRTRAHVVRWLDGLPFVVDNVNGLLNGVADTLVVRFEGTPPSQQALNQRLETVHEECFVVAIDETAHEVQLRIGVIESKLNPAGAMHRRYRRTVGLIDQVLAPMHSEHRIAHVRVA